MAENKDKGFTQGSVRIHVMRLSGFMIMGFLAMTLGQLVETAYLGMVGKNELAAIAFTFPIVMGLNAMTRGIGVGAGSLLARIVGAGDRRDAGILTTHCILLVLMFTISCSIFGGLFAEPLFVLLGARDEVLTLAVQYVHIWLLGFPVFGVALISTGLIRSFGNVVFPGVIMSTGPLIQVLVGPFLIFGWAGLSPLGLERAAWAFVTGAVFQFLLAIYWFLIREQLLQATLKSFSHSSWEILHVGIPASATNLIQPLSAGVVTWLLAGHGSLVVAGFGVASRVESVVSMVAIGISTSVVPLVGQNWGAREFDRVDQALKFCHQACLLWGLAAASIMWLGADYFISLINDDDKIVITASTYLHIVPITIGFMGMMNVATHSFNALRKPIPALILSLMRLVVVYIPLAYLGNYLYGYVGVFGATAVANFTMGIAAVVWNRRVVIRERNLILARPA